MRDASWMMMVVLLGSVCMTGAACGDDSNNAAESNVQDMDEPDDEDPNNDGVDGDDEPDMVCVLDETCEGLCGPVTDACGQEVACGPCHDEDEVARLMAPVNEMIDLIDAESYMVDILGLDVGVLRQDAAELIRQSPDAERGQLLALTQSMRAFRNGHSGLFPRTTTCRDLGGGDNGMTAYGVCAKPYQDHYVVTHLIAQANPLGLSPGDEILGFNGHLGAAMTQEILSKPLCGAVATNEVVAQEHAAESIFSVANQGDTLLVRSPDGVERTVEVTAPLRSYDQCRFPAGAVSEPFVEARLRDDGVAVIKIHRMILFEGEEGWIQIITQAHVEQYVDNMMAQVQAAFESVHEEATGIIWDARANIGGASPLSFAIAGGMPGARQVPLARCTTRRAGSDPVAYDAFGPNYDLVRDDRVQTDKPTAVLFDGRAVSAADYFALAVSLGTDAMIFGRPTAGGYGGGGLGRALESDDRWYVAYDPYRCNDLEGQALETRSVQPDVFVEYEPADLAVGRDTVLEAAAEWIHTQE